MKNIKAMSDPEEIKAYVRDLWRTDLFRDSQDAEYGYIRGIVDDLVQRPVIFFEMNDPSIEWSQFTTWMGAYALRPDYESDAVHDLYYLHEFVHGATMEYDANISFVDWHRKMCENEMLASMHSEAYVYFLLEGLRDQSFDFEIWADRYLEAPRRLHSRMMPLDIYQRRMTTAQNYEDLREGLLVARKASMTTPDPFDYLEMQIHYYGMQNVQWSNIWAKRFREVERHMVEYFTQAEEDRQGAVEKHVEWLESKLKSKLGMYNVTPYQDEAVAFAKVVAANKKRQGNDILKA